MYHEKRKSSVADPDCSHQRESRCSADGTESGSCVVSTRTKLGVYEKAVLEVMESRRSLRNSLKMDRNPETPGVSLPRKSLMTSWPPKEKHFICSFPLSPLLSSTFCSRLTVSAKCEQPDTEPAESRIPESADLPGPTE